MKTIKSLLIILLLLVMVGCTNKKFMEDYPQLKDNKHIYEVIDADETLKLINKDETCLLVMGFKECPWCQALMPYVNEVAKNEGLKIVYYVDIKDMRDNQESVDHSKYLQIKEVFKDAVDKEKDRINAPTIIALKDGQMVGFHLDTVSTHMMEDGMLPPLNTKQQTELKEIIKNLVNKIK